MRARSSDRPAARTSAPATPTSAGPGNAATAAQLQLDAAAPGAGAGSSAHELASVGVDGGGSELPHRAAIESSFGMDLGGVRAHVGGAAAGASRALGANAYATGSDVAFAKSPDLHTAAHEATHVVQQRSGVQLLGGVGQVGDSYERHADAVADAVVSGQSASGLLSGFSGGGGSTSSAVQLDSTTVTLPEALGPAQSGDVATQGDGDANAFSPNDVNQGSIGDCYFLASLVAIANSQPQLLQQAIHANADGSYTVRMYRPEQEEYLFGLMSERVLRPVQVVIWPTFPLEAAGHDAANPNADANPGHAHGGDVDAAGNPELWVRLFEKAYALLMGSYATIGKGGLGANALEALTGETYTEEVNDGDTHERIIELVGEGVPVEVGTKPADFYTSLSEEQATWARDNSVVGGHAYAVMAADESGITVRNPWGAGARVAEPRLTWAQYDLYFNQFSNRT